MSTTPSNTRLLELYNRQADQYDKLRKRKKNFDHAWRRLLLAEARGKVLELSVGAGANFKFYPQDIVLTAVDISPAMIVRAREAARQEGLAAELICSAVEDLQLAPGSFDTVVSTLSLCAYGDPVGVVRQMQHWCRPGGHILLMEHGLARPRIAQWIQHRLDRFQYRRIGCHANRDIPQIILEAGLNPYRVERKMLGAIYLVWAKASIG